MRVSNLWDLHRFLWNKDSDQLPRGYRFLSMVIGARDSPYMSSATIHHHLDEIIHNSEEEEEVKIAKLIKIRLYIDGLLLSLDSPREAIKLRKMVTDIFHSAGMVMTKWATNSQEVRH